MILVTDKHAFFYTEWPSNFCKTKFAWTKFGETHEFFCTEQAFMWAKAMYFGDREIAAKILAVADNPMLCKNLGRQVRNYDDSAWDKVRYQMFLEPNLERFRQDADLRCKLLDKRFDGLKFVEASPIDRIWGIGLGMDTSIEKLDDESRWRGRNLLGEVITECRRVVKKEFS
jgi:hypothetical protein